MKKSLLKFIFVGPNETVINSLIKLKKVGLKCLIVVDKNKNLLGTFSDGDLRSAILTNPNLKNKISLFYNKKPKFIKHSQNNIEKSKKFFLNYKIDIIPVLKNKKVIDVISWADIFISKTNNKIKDVSTIILAGGKGERMQPFTKVLPKPLLPIRDKTVIDIILEKFSSIGIKTFTVMINYKGNLIKGYLSSQKKYKIEYYTEKFPLGTAGSLSILNKKKLSEDFFVSNCDIVIQGDLNKILEFHKKNKNIITLVVCHYMTQLPYGSCITNKKGKLLDINEKPNINHLINTGLYILNKKALTVLKKNRHEDFNNFLKKCIKRKMKIMVYAVDSESWHDVGTWSKYEENHKSL